MKKLLLTCLFFVFPLFVFTTSASAQTCSVTVNPGERFRSNDFAVSGPFISGSSYRVVLQRSYLDVDRFARDETLVQSKEPTDGQLRFSVPADTPTSALKEGGHTLIVFKDEGGRTIEICRGNYSISLPTCGAVTVEPGIPNLQDNFVNIIFANAGQFPETYIVGAQVQTSRQPGSIAVQKSGERSYIVKIRDFRATGSYRVSLTVTEIIGASQGRSLPVCTSPQFTVTEKPVEGGDQPLTSGEQATVYSSGPEYCGVANQGIKTAIGCIPIRNTGAFVGWVLGWAIGIAGGIAFLLIIFSSFQIMTAAGNPDKLQGGRELLTAAISGLILIVFSVFLLRLIGVDILGLPGFTP